MISLLCLALQLCHREELWDAQRAWITKLSFNNWNHRTFRLEEDLKGDLDSAIGLMCVSSVNSFLARWAQSLCLNICKRPFSSSVPPLGGSNSYKSLLHVGLTPIPYVTLLSPWGQVVQVCCFFLETAALLPSPLPPPLPGRQGSGSLHHPLASFRATRATPHLWVRVAEPMPPSVLQSAPASLLSWFCTFIKTAKS